MSFRNWSPVRHRGHDWFNSSILTGAPQAASYVLRAEREISCYVRLFPPQFAISEWALLTRTVHADRITQEVVHLDGCQAFPCQFGGERRHGSGERASDKAGPRTKTALVVTELVVVATFVREADHAFRGAEIHPVCRQQPQKLIVQAVGVRDGCGQK
jgi:hypothetical protein